MNKISIRLGVRSVAIFSATCLLSWEILNRCIYLPGQIGAFYLGNTFLFAQYLFPFMNYYIEGPDCLFSTPQGWIATGVIFLAAIATSFFVGTRFRSLIACIAINISLMLTCSLLLHAFGWLNSAKFLLTGP